MPRFLFIFVTMLLGACAGSGLKTVDMLALKAEVTATERAFAQSMADRDAAAFARFIAEEAVFFGGKQPLRGKDVVVAGWAGFFKGDQAPFSWQPDEVEVLASGDLAHSSGPVYNTAGELIARFNSIWRRNSDGQWKIVFDKGNDICPQKAP